MSRSIGALLLLVIAAILAVVGVSYYRQKESQARSAPAQPKSLPSDLSAAAEDWIWYKDEGGLRRVEVRAKNFRQLSNSQRLELEL